MKFVWLHCHHVHNSHAIKYLIKQRLGQSLSIKCRWTHYRFPKMKWLNLIRWIYSVTHWNYRRLIKPFIVSQLLSHHSCHDNWNAQLIQSHKIVSALHRDVMSLQMKGNLWQLSIGCKIYWTKLRSRQLKWTIKEEEGETSQSNGRTCFVTLLLLFWCECICYTFPLSKVII